MGLLGALGLVRVAGVGLLAQGVVRGSWGSRGLE